MVRRLTGREFIERANRIHNNKYSYYMTIYYNKRSKVNIICPNHGIFSQEAGSHLVGKGCAKCFGNARKSTEEFIEDARKVHGEKFDYSKVKYINNYTKVCIICKIHSEFWQEPKSHIYEKTGCPKCNSNYSQISIKFLNILSKDLNEEIQHAENKGEFKIYDFAFKCSYYCDGYFEKDNKKYVIEFHGDYFHGNPKIYKPDSICKLRHMRFDELYKKTMERMYRIKALGYEVIYIWEYDFQNYLNDPFGFIEDYYIIL